MGNSAVGIASGIWLPATCHATFKLSTIKTREHEWGKPARPFVGLQMIQGLEGGMWRRSLGLGALKARTCQSVFNYRQLPGGARCLGTAPVGTDAGRGRSPVPVAGVVRTARLDEPAHPLLIL